ncbi:Von Willebrand factor, type A [Sulfitobacter noctilucicola]|uniref:Ca-activated chloride channel family protein n=1 Tax=Sulfitobacter noctilucicola TaxID=1342301 RepID=A0A7W6M7I9_9RHOB|nr:VWA domain-containing protein [Sulfitobacter noctilucicola]KIN62544.1 Von Willebrand factor, type A [Sulfitobacter noctilucicola]MBB4172926.1 Ca-activated chloride channel family protein [Sulfitobacter noctilucicola]
MTDDLDDLKSLMNAATPQPDAARKAENIALAQKNFANLQGSRGELRPTSDRPKPGFITGVRHMLNILTSRGALTASTALVAVGIIALTPLGTHLIPQSSDAPFIPPAVQEAPATTQMRETEADEPAIAELSAPMVEMEMAAQDMAGQGIAQSAAKSNIRMAAPSSPTMMVDAPVIMPQNTTESFANADANPVVTATQSPVSTFSIDIDTASYAIVRNSLLKGQMPDKDAVRVEEMINYFSYDYAAPSEEAAFAPTVTLSQTPWNSGTQLLEIGIQGAEVTERPPLNLVFLIDTSGSMQDANKLPLLKKSFRLMLGQLRPEDQVAIVTYAGSAGQVLDPTPASERTTILNALENLSAGGSTAGQAGLQQAYATAAGMAQDGDVSRVILATDGDFNVGLHDPDALKDYIADKRASGTYLSVLGFGRGNLDDATMQALAQNGNGQAAYIDTLSEAQKVLVDQLSGALFPIADDVKIQVEFNPATVAEYRLIGYETRTLKREDFNNDKVDAGDIGAGHQVTAIYEITPSGSPAILNDDLRYATAQTTGDSDELAFLRLRYKAPGANTSTLIETPISADISGNASFATAIAGFGQLLRDGTYLGDWSFADAIELADKTKGDDPFGYRAEAIQLMRLAQSLSAQ